MTEPRLYTSEEKRWKRKEERFFDDALAAAMLCHMRGKPIDPEALRTENDGLPTKQLYALIRTPRFIEALESRGIPSQDATRLTRDMVEVLRILADASLDLSERARVERVGVDWNVFLGWMDFAPFKEQYNQFTQDTIRKAIPAARRALAGEAQRGNLQAIKYMFEYSGEYDPATKQVDDVRQMMRDIFTIIAKTVTDQDQLLKIASDMSSMMPGTVAKQLE